MSDQPKVTDTESQGRLGCLRWQLAVLVFLMAAGVACLIVFGRARGIERFSELLGMLAVGGGILLAVVFALSLYYSLYWRWRLKPSREKINSAIKLYDEGKCDEALAICGKLADDPGEPPLARVLACANCASFTRETGNSEEEEKWREKAFAIDRHRAERVFALLIARAQEDEKEPDDDEIEKPSEGIEPSPKPESGDN
ncbi:MAG: hypothetical protein E3J72_07975 [Planctomycetota bacterium]|nr:MAG: hypothetical protein E3J72_07975 [Planctomycetota bacterium]